MGRTLVTRTRVVVSVAVVLGIVVGGLAGYMAYRGSHDALARGRAADAARWQAQAEAWLATQEPDPADLERGRAADAARWQAQAEAWLAAQSLEREALARGRAADAARWQAQAEAWLAG